MESGFRRTRRALSMAALACCTAFAGSGALAQGFPGKPVRIIVGAPAGSTPDMMARLMIPALTEQWGQPVIVDNKPGGSGLIGTQELLKAAPDGHTLMIAPDGLVSEVPHVVKVPFDYFKEVRPLADLGRGGLVLLGSSQVPASDVAGLIGYIKARPGKINYASYSTGTLSHTLGLEMNRIFGIDMVHVGYRGAPPALQDLAGGAIPLMVGGVSTSLPLLKAGKVKAYAVTSPTRSSALPDVPTFAELGYKDLTESLWMGLWVDADVPAPTQARIRQAVLKAMQQPKVRDHLAALGQEPGSGATPEELVRALHTASDKQAARLKALGFKPE